LPNDIVSCISPSKSLFFGIKTVKKLKNLRSDNYIRVKDLGHRVLCPISDSAKKARGRRLILDSDTIGKTDKQSGPGLEIGRGSGPTPVARGGSGAKAPPLAARPVLRNGRGRR